MNRRGFFAALVALPFVPKAWLKPATVSYQDQWFRIWAQSRARQGITSPTSWTSKEITLHDSVPTFHGIPIEYVHYTGRPA